MGTSPEKSELTAAEAKAIGLWAAQKQIWVSFACICGSRATRALGAEWQ